MKYLKASIPFRYYFFWSSFKIQKYKGSKTVKQILIVYVQDEPGVLNRVSSMIRKRNYNIDSLVAGETENARITRMTIVLNEPDKTKQSVIVNNLKRLNDVYDVVDATNINCHLREYALLKIAISEVDSEEIKELLNNDHSRILDEDDDVMIVELSGYESTVKNTIALLEKYDIVELMRLGKMAMVSGNDESYQPKLVKSDPSWTTQRLSEVF